MNSVGPVRKDIIVTVRIEVFERNVLTFVSYLIVSIYCTIFTNLIIIPVIMTIYIYPEWYMLFGIPVLFSHMCENKKSFIGNAAD